MSQGRVTVSPVSGNDTARALQQAAALGGIGSEETMYPVLVGVLNRLLPTGFEARSHASSEEGRPDISIVQRPGGTRAPEAAAVAHIEVKHAATLDSAFRTDASGEHQIGRYRRSGLPVLLTDCLRWFDVTSSDALELPAARFGDDATPPVAEQQLRGLLHLICGRRPLYASESAVAAMAGIVAQIDSVVADDLAEGWRVVRTALGFGGGETLDAGERGVGEIVAFTLLSIAAHLPPLPDDGFADAAAAEWAQEGEWSTTAGLPAVMQAALDQFRLYPPAKQALGGATGWVAIRALSAHLSSSPLAQRDKWARLSSLWDDYLANAGRRKTLGSWQTPEAIARFQARQTHEALQRLGYAKGLGDEAVTVIDPCVGTGVYLDAVIAEAGCSPQAFNADGPDNKPRLLGADISPTAVAATHIRTTATGAEPQLYMTDTLHTSATGDTRPLLDSYEHGLSMVISAARWDWHEMSRWAARDPGRDPILAIIGNPPYLRAGLDQERYAGIGWRQDVYEKWRAGSGGRGGLDDPFVGFWAWALNVCRRPHDSLHSGDASNGEPSLCGVVSFITNRAWIHGDTFGPMRRWVRSRASLIQVTDFGPGSRGGAGRWSAKQPFAIQTGTAIVTMTFDPTDGARTLRYQRAAWSDKEQMLKPHGDEFSAAYDQQAGDAPWTLHIKDPERSLLGGMTTVSGVKTADDKKWISVKASKSRFVRHAYRALDNRYSPNAAPEKVKRGEPVPSDKASGWAEWCKEKLFDPHEAHIQAGGWYAILQAQIAKPGPAIHATRHLPDNNLFKGSEGGYVVRVGPGIQIPVDYRSWADSQRLSGEDFWHYALAATHHPDYWVEGTERAESLAHRTVEIPLTDDSDIAAELVTIGEDLVDIWSVDGLPAAGFEGHAGAWHFEDEEALEDVKINGRPVLKKWREARPGDWDENTAREYARTVLALRMLLNAKDKVGALLD